MHWTKRTARRPAMFAVLLVAAAAATAIAGCSASTPTNKKTAASSPHSAKTHITVAIVPKLLGLSVFEANVQGAKEIAPSLNESIDYTASVDASGPDQAAVIMGLVNSNNPPNVIAYSANDPTSEVPALLAAKKAGINLDLSRS